MVAWKFAPPKLNHRVPKDDRAGFCLAGSCPPRSVGELEDEADLLSAAVAHAKWAVQSRAASRGHTLSRVQIGSCEVDCDVHRRWVIAIKWSCCRVLTAQIFKKIYKQSTFQTIKTKTKQTCSQKCCSWNNKYCKYRGPGIFRNF